MTKFDASRIQWREPWLAVSSDHAPKLEAEFRHEICAKHVLFGRSITAIGRRQDCDDILVYLGETPPRFAVVHLTYQQEKQPDWPKTTLFDSLESWVEQRMIRDAEEFVS